MNYFKTWFLRTSVLAIYGLVALVAAALGPVIAKAQCPIIQVRCPSGKIVGCAGTPVGTYCRYDAGCLSGSRCGS
jgi:hypothetical protein